VAVEEGHRIEELEEDERRRLFGEGTRRDYSSLKISYG
jgi:hypothetical protein